MGDSDNDEKLFVKFLTSDVDQKTAYTLFQKLRQADAEIWKRFSDPLMNCLAQVCAVLSFNHRDDIITQDEPATFLGFLLAGSLTVSIARGSQTTRHELSPGAILGEMAFFCKEQTRNASVTAGKNCVLAVSTYEFRVCSVCLLVGLDVPRSRTGAKVFICLARLNYYSLRNYILAESIIILLLVLERISPVGGYNMLICRYR